MKQLLIVSDNTYANGSGGALSNAKDLSTLNAGALLIFTPGTLAKVTSALGADFAIALGQSKGPAIIIPDVDYHTLKVTKATKQAASNFSATVTIPSSTTLGDTYTVVIVKKGAAPHERNTWTATETVFNTTTQTGSVVAAAMQAKFDAVFKAAGMEIGCTVSDNVLTFTGTNGAQWDVKAGDDLASSAISVSYVGYKATLDAAYIKDLALQCAAGKGFTDTYRDGDTIYPGFPEPVSGTEYVLYTLRFAVGRKSAKTRDERVSQLVHIAVPKNETTNTVSTGLIAVLDTILGVS